MSSSPSSSSSSSSFPSIYNNEEGLKKLGTYLRSLHGVKVRSGIEHDKRVEYFKGKRLIECLLEGQNWPKSLPRITDKGMALELASTLLQKGYFHRSEKNTERKGHLIISPKKVFEEVGYYTWMFSGSMVWSNVATIAVIIVVIIFTLLPVWPAFAKKVLWYMAVTFLLVLFVFILVRFLLFLFMWILGYEFWIFPRLFDETLGFVDSFKPVYVFDKGTPGQGYYRIALLIALVSFIVWAARQPTEFDGFLQAQKEFVDDLYSGNLLTDYSQSAKDTIDRNKRVPDLEDLLRQIELDEIAADVTKSNKNSNDEENQADNKQKECLDDEDECNQDEYVPDFESEETVDEE
mmetsp:Transcript_13278/g.13765  ORF Transcript_13278/g.13765 Transcript_13278/m.13765 type:complete len:349 (-) Transcript_13278:316-1362(-)